MKRVESCLPECEALINERRRDIAPPELRSAVAGIVQAVRSRGDAALCEYTSTFDKVALKPAQIRLSDDEWDVAIEPGLEKALKKAIASVRAYHEQQKRPDWFAQRDDGGYVGEVYRPVDRAGLYVPAGTAPLVSTVVMTVVPAQVAGVREICVASPPRADGKVNPGILAACRLCGITEIYRMGGAQAVAALAFGTKSVRRVDVIAGPGNAYVTEAKRQVYGYVGIDLIAGPSESLIIADASADPAYVAADILSQAEHHGSSTYLVCDSGLLLDRVEAHIATLLSTTLADAELKKAVAGRLVAIHVKSLDEAADVANLIAPEHLQIMTGDDAAVLKRIRHAGAVFLGAYSPVPLGDFVAGPSHVLPTGATARYMSGLSTEVFRKRMSVMNFSAEGFADVAEAIETIARYEELPAHEHAAAVRRAHTRK